MTNCPLCNPQAEKALYNNELFRVIEVDDDNFPGYFRVIANKHVKEMSDLSTGEQFEIIRALGEIEKIMLRTLETKKINWAQLGNMVPHLHWHIVARYEDDATFPDSIWSPVRRETSKQVLEERKELAGRCAEEIKAHFGCK